MSLGSPWMLLWLAVVPLFVLAYARIVQLRSRRAARLASEGLVPVTASRRGQRFRRHVPFALFASALILVCVGLARPTMSLALPQREGTVILAFDVSNSMRATDLAPTRIAAAKAAATAFAERQPSTIRIGVVAFGDGALTVLRPTDVKKDVVAAIRRLSPGGATSLGQGIYTSLSAIAGKPLQIDETALESDGGEVDIGFFGSSAIVLLSDGENTSRPDPLQIAEVASSAGVPIHAIGLGTPEGTVVQIDGFSIATALDEALLTEIADVTDGTYRRAGDASTLEEDLRLRRPRARSRRASARGDGAVRGRGRARARARVAHLDRLVRKGDLNVVRVAARARVPRRRATDRGGLLVAASPTAAAGGQLLERCAAAVGAAEAQALAEAPPDGHGARESRRARLGRRPATRGAERCPSREPRSSSRSTSQARCARRTSSRTG